MTSVRKFDYDIGPEWSGKTIKAFLQHHRFSTAVISMLKNNPYGITIGNKRVTVLKQLHVGDRLTLRVREKTEPLPPAAIPIEIVYEDEDIAVVNKPADMPVHPVQNNRDRTLGNAMVYYWQQQNKQYGYHPISRLDKDTTGLLVVAKNAHAAGLLSAAVKRREVVREYLALAEGELEGEGTLRFPIVRCENSVIKRRVGETETDATRAITHYKVLQNYSDYTLVRLRLETGRTHQIRVHLAHIGHPLCGDWLYGHEGFLLNRPALHAYHLSFVHPISGQPLEFTAPLPDDMKKGIDYEIIGI